MGKDIDSQFNECLNKGKIKKFSEEHIDAFQTAKIMRENADYEENYSEVGANKLVKAAGDFLKVAKEIL